MIFKTKEEAARALADSLETWCREEGFRSMALSGGSTPGIWFELLAREYQDRLPWEDLLFFWGDERCVPPEDPESNYGMAHAKLLSRVNAPQDHIFRIRGEAPPEEEAVRYGQVLRESLPMRSGIPQMDLVLLGMGDDGHTASIFPHEGFLWDAPADCVVATHPLSGQQRISLTGRIINNARAVVFLVTGPGKAGRVRQVIEALPGHGDLPASRVSPSHGRLLWILDADAASGLR